MIIKIRKLLVILIGFIAIFSLASCDESEYNTLSILDGTIDDYVIDNFYESYENLPDWLQEDFQNRKWSVVLVPNLSEEYGDNISGITVYDDKCVYLEASAFGTTKHTMCHEIGHYLDCILDWVSRTDEFKDIFDEENQIYYENLNPSNHVCEGSSEYWADSCFYYFALPEKLEKYCPETYQYLNSFISDYSGVDNIPIAYN